MTNGRELVSSVEQPLSVHRRCGAVLPQVLGQLHRAPLVHLALQNQADVSLRQVAARAPSALAAADGFHRCATHRVEYRHETHALPVEAGRCQGERMHGKLHVLMRRSGRFIPMDGWKLELLDRAIQNSHELLNRFRRFLSIIAWTFCGFLIICPAKDRAVAARHKRRKSRAPLPTHVAVANAPATCVGNGAFISVRT